MTSVQEIVLLVGFVAAATAMIAIMVRANRNELRTIQRRRQEWIDAGADPDDEPNFYSGSGGSQGS